MKESISETLYSAFATSLEITTKIVAIVAPLSLICAIIFNVVFWNIIDSEIFGLLMLSDYIATAIGVLPLMAGASAAVFIVFGTLRLLPVADPLRRSFHAGRMASNRRAPAVFLLVVGAAILGAAFLLPEKYRVLPLCMGGMGMLLGAAMSFIVSSKTEESLVAVGISCVVAFAFYATILLAAAAGGLSALNLKYDAKATHVLLLTDGTQIDRVARVRAFSQGMFVYDLDGPRARFIVWSEIKELRPM